MEAKTAMPFSDLSETLRIVQKAKDDYLDSNCPTEEEVERTYDKAINFLMKVGELYFDCAGCGRKVAPDEESYQDPASENWYCMTCLNEGI